MINLYTLTFQTNVSNEITLQDPLSTVSFFPEDSESVTEFSMIPEELYPECNIVQCGDKANKCKLVDDMRSAQEQDLDELAVLNTKLKNLKSQRKELLNQLKLKNKQIDYLTQCSTSLFESQGLKQECTRAKGKVK